MLRIPRRVTLPFGYVIAIKQLSDREFNSYDADADGLWAPGTRTIYIRERIPAKRKAYLLAHELGHAWLDWQHEYLNHGDVRP